MGQTVYRGPDIQSQDFSHLPVGIYVLKVSGAEVHEYKLVKE